MKQSFLVIMLGIINLGYGQKVNQTFESISIAYLGEMITHPGLKIGLDYQLKAWEGKTKEKQKAYTLNLKPSLGGFYHKNYQTALSLTTELIIHRQNEKGGFIEAGIGLGYLQTIIPNTYKVSDQGIVEKTLAGHPYGLTNYAISFGKDLKVSRELPYSYFIKPQLMYALPQFPSGLSYFALEFGLNYHFIKAES